LQIRGINQARYRLDKFKDLMDGTVDEPYDPLLIQIGRYICSNSTEECLDIKHINQNSRLSTALSGVSRFLAGNTKSKLSDFKNVLLFSVGGLTFNESIKLQNMFAKAGKNLIVGSNNVCSRDFLYSSIIKK
jgi:hypothetical protein